MMTSIRLAVPMLGLVATALDAQCTNGSPPPCPRGSEGRPVVRVVRSQGREARITVTYSATPMSYVLADFEQAGQLSIIRSLAVDTQSISVRFLDTRWDSAFASVVQAKGLVTFRLPTGAMVVRTGKEDQLSIQTEPIEFFSVTLGRVRPAIVESFLRTRMLTERGTWSNDTATNTMMIAEVVSRVRRLHQLVDSLLDAYPRKEP